jgi:methylenetetrahydrofolate dehydrogenase (NADP+)/methenyltetrahydrofolate cyclohydrolase
MTLEHHRTEELVHARLLEGRALAKELRADLKARIAGFPREYGFLPALKVLLIGEEEDSVLYAQNIVRWFSNLGLKAFLVTLPDTAAPGPVIAEVRSASSDPDVHGVLVQMPLPPQLDYHDVFCALDPLKDVEGLHPENIGLLASGRPRFVPSTPLAGLRLLDAYGVPLAGAEVVILGRSNVVGKPLAQLMLQRDASVTVLHSRSRDLAAHVSRADVVAAAVGRPELVTGDMLKPGAVVLDFGINFVGGELVGDVAFDQALDKASLITPVPGGIGPLTNLMLASNLLLAASLQARSAHPAGA